MSTNEKLKSSLKNGKMGTYFPGSPVAKTLSLMQGTWVQSLVRKLDPTCLLAKKTET